MWKGKANRCRSWSATLFSHYIEKELGESKCCTCSAIRTSVRAGLIQRLHLHLQGLSRQELCLFCKHPVTKRSMLRVVPPLGSPPPLLYTGALRKATMPPACPAAFPEPRTCFLEALLATRMKEWTIVHDLVHLPKQGSYPLCVLLNNFQWLHGNCRTKLRVLFWHSVPFISYSKFMTSNYTKTLSTNPETEAWRDK